MTGLPAEILAGWPGRFRFASLLVQLSDPGPADPVLVVDAVLDGLIAGRPEPEVLAELVQDGHFAVAQQMIEQCEALTEQQRASARERLEGERSKAVQRLTGRWRRHRSSAEAADLEIEDGLPALEELCHESWSRADIRMTGLEEALRDRIETAAAELRARFEADAAEAPVAPRTRASFEALVKADRLRTAAFLLEHGNLGTPGPEAVPRLPSWPWGGETADNVLQHYLDPSMYWPLDFDRWEVVDERAQRLLQDFDGLASSGEGSAAAFADSLDRFVGAEPGSATVHRIPGGYLTTLQNVFRDDQVMKFGPNKAVDLFVADLGTSTPPVLEEIDYAIAVGRALEPDPSRRGPTAVLGLRDLLLLVTDTVRPSVSLLRILGRQWPLSAFGAGSPGQLQDLFSGDPEARWDTLHWLTDLAGLGDLSVAEALVFQTGYEPRLLHELLTFLSQPGPRRSAEAQWARINHWRDDEQLSAALEAAAVHDVSQSPYAMAAFWTAMGAARPGELVTVDAMVRTLALEGDDGDREDVLRAGMAELSAQWMTADSAGDHLTLRDCGTLIGLQGLASQRIREVAKTLTGDAPDLAGGDAEYAEPTAWDADRYALSPHWAGYLQLLADEGESSQKVADERRNLVAPLEGFLGELEEAEGTTDLIGLVAEIREHFLDRYPSVALSVDAPPTAAAAVDDRVARVILHELLANAAEALPGGGSVSLRIRVSDDVIIDVIDSGPGIAGDIGNVYRVFRKGVSTKGKDRGQGLFVARELAQRAEGQLELVSHVSRHPVLRGAHFRLALPRDEAPVAGGGQ